MSEYKESTYDRIGQDGKDTEDTYEGVNRMPNDEWFKSLGMKPIISTRKSKLIHMNKFNRGIKTRGATMSHPVNDEIFDKAFEAGRGQGYVDALKNLLQFADTLESSPILNKLLKYIGKELEGAK